MQLGASWSTLLVEFAEHELCGPATRTAIAYLRDLFSGPTALGPTMAGAAEQLVGDPAVLGASAAVLAGDVITLIDACTAACLAHWSRRG